MNAKKIDYSKSMDGPFKKNYPAFQIKNISKSEGLTQQEPASCRRRASGVFRGFPSRSRAGGNEFLYLPSHHVFWVVQRWGSISGFHMSKGVNHVAPTRLVVGKASLDPLRSVQSKRFQTLPGHCPGVWLTRESSTVGASMFLSHSFFNGSTWHMSGWWPSRVSVKGLFHFALVTARHVWDFFWSIPPQKNWVFGHFNWIN